MSNSRQIESLTFHTIKKALSSVCEVDIKVERKVEINEVEEARREERGARQVPKQSRCLKWNQSVYKLKSCLF